MRKFNYLKLMELSLPVSIYHTIVKIHEYKGKQELYVENKGTIKGDVNLVGSNLVLGDNVTLNK